MLVLMAKMNILKIFVKTTSILIVSFMLFYGHANGANMSTPNQLVEDLLGGYGSRFVRPVKNVNKTVEVTFRAKPVWFAVFDELHQMLTITSNNQLKWKDEFLTWNPNSYEGIEEVDLRKDQIWFPDVIALERLYVGASTVNQDEPYVKVNYKGEVVYYNMALFSVYCKMDVRLYPFDEHDCKIIFTPYSFQAKEVSLCYSKAKEAKENLLKRNGAWSVTDIHFEDVTVRHLCCPEPYTEIHYTLRVKRVSGFYVLNFGVPSIFISLATVAVFLLHPESGEKVSLCVTNVLALIIFQQLIAHNMPPTGDRTPIIAYYFVVVIGIAFMSVLTTTVTLGMYHHDGSRPLPGWLRRLLMMESEYGRRPSEIKLGDIDSRNNIDGMIGLDRKSSGERDSIVKIVRNPLATSRSGVPMDTSDCESSDISYQDEWREAAIRIDKVLFCLSMIAMITVFLLSVYFLGTGASASK